MVIKIYGGPEQIRRPLAIDVSVRVSNACIVTKRKKDLSTFLYTIRKII